MMANKIWMGGLVARVCAMLFAVAACAPADVPDEVHAAVESALQATVDRLAAENDIPGIQAAVVLPDGAVVQAAAGLADIESQIPMTSELRIISGSIGKTYVAAALMSLVEENKLDLGARVGDYLGDEDWWRGFPNADTVTLGQLLNHSSGVPRDYLEHPEFLAALEKSITDGADFAEQGYTHEDYVRWVSGLAPAFAPGEGFHYSDVAYTVGALLVEKVSGRSIETDIEERFLTPLGLTTTEPQQRQMTNFVSAYVPPSVRAQFSGVPEKSVTMGAFAFDPKFEWGGGGYVSNANDLARWADAWFGGKALDSDYVEMMKAWGNEQVWPPLGDAYGIALQVRHASPFGERLYHGGYGLGFIARTEYLPEHKMASAIMINTVALEYEAFHDDIWRAVFEAMDIELNE